MATEDEGSGVGSLVKGALIVLGGLAAIGLVLSVLKPLLIIGVLGGAGYLGYRMLSSKGKEIEGAPKRAALPPDSDFDKRMRELEKIEKQLDAEIRSHDR